MVNLVRVKSLKKGNKVLWNPLTGRWNLESSKSRVMKELKGQISNFVEGNEYSLKLPENVDFEDLDPDIKNIIRPLLIKKTRDFKPTQYNIVNVLKQVHPDCAISADAKKILNTFLDKLMFIIYSKGINTLEKLYEFINDFMIGQLKRYTVSACKTEVTRYKTTGRTWLKFKHTDDEFNIACMALLEYLSAEILEIAGTHATNMLRSTIKNTDLFNPDQELFDLAIKVSKTVNEIENKNLVELSKLKKTHVNLDANILNKISDFYRLY